MSIPSLERLRDFVDSVNLNAPKFETKFSRVKIIGRCVNYNTITDILMLLFCAIMIQRADQFGAIIPGILLLLMIYVLWYDYNAVNTIEINFDSDEVLVKYKSPFRLLLFFLEKRRKRVLKISTLSGFFYKPTAQRISFRRFRLYAEAKDSPDVLLIDFSSEEHARKVADYLNKAAKEAAKQSASF